jgi:hypothetical protein
VWNGTGPRQSQPVQPIGEESAMTGIERDELALAQTLGWAQEAADRADFDEAIDWLHVVELVHGALPDEWTPTRQAWRTLATVR